MLPQAGVTEKGCVLRTEWSLVTLYAHACGVGGGVQCPTAGAITAGIVALSDGDGIGDVPAT